LFAESRVSDGHVKKMGELRVGSLQIREGKNHQRSAFKMVKRPVQTSQERICGLGGQENRVGSDGKEGKRVVRIVILRGMMGNLQRRRKMKGNTSLHGKSYLHMPGPQMKRSPLKPPPRTLPPANKNSPGFQPNPWNHQSTKPLLKRKTPAKKKPASTTFYSAKERNKDPRTKPLHLPSTDRRGKQSVLRLSRKRKKTGMCLRKFDIRGKHKKGPEVVGKKRKHHLSGPHFNFYQNSGVGRNGKNGFYFSEKGKPPTTSKPIVSPGKNRELQFQDAAQKAQREPKSEREHCETVTRGLKNGDV